MTLNDLIGGFALAGFFAVPFGLLGMLFMRITERPREYDPDEPLMPTRDVKLVLQIAITFAVIGGPVFALLFRADRQDAESWQAYSRDHKCVVVDTRTRTEYHSGYPGTSHAENITENLWRCEGGDEHWRR